MAYITLELKEKAMKMAKKEGLTMKALLSFLLKGYTEQEIVLTSKRRQPRGIFFETEELSDEEIELVSKSSKIQSLHKRLQEL